MSSQPRQPFIEKLPEEMMSMIFSELTVVQLARAQQTCKRWHNIAQKNSTLWTDAAPFFNHIQKWQVPAKPLMMHTNPSSNRIQQWQGLDRKRISLQLRGLRKLKELSNNKLDGIVLHSDYNIKQYGYDSLRQIIFKALREHPPTRMTITECRDLQTRYGGIQDDPRLELLAKNESLKHLSLHIASASSPWQLKLACSLESLVLTCLPLSECSNKEELMKSLMNIKRMRLQTSFERPGNLEFLDKVGQKLEDLELIERCYYLLTRRPNGEKKITIRFPNLLKLKLDSPTCISSNPYQLDCPRLQSLSVRENLLSSEGRLHELLLKTDTITHVSVSIYLSKYGPESSSEDILNLFFGKFRRIKIMHVSTGSKSALQYLVNTLPETVSKLAITLEEIRDNGGITKEAKDDDNLLCIFTVRESPKSKQYKVTILGRKNLHDLAFGCGK